MLGLFSVKALLYTKSPIFLRILISNEDPNAHGRMYTNTLLKISIASATDNSFSLNYFRTWMT